MAKGKKHTAEQIVNLLRQVEVAVANGKTLPQACKDARRKDSEDAEPDRRIQQRVPDDSVGTQTGIRTHWVAQRRRRKEPQDWTQKEANARNSWTSFKRVSTAIRKSPPLASEWNKELTN
jgi:hypothetical protein